MVQRVKMPSNLGRKNSSKRYLQFMSSIVGIQQQSKRLLYGACVNGMRTHVLKCHSIQIKIGMRKRNNAHSQTHSCYKLCSKHQAKRQLIERRDEQQKNT